MIRSVLRLVGTEIRGLHEAAYLLGFFAVLSTLMALVRDRLLAGTFGAGEMLDIYYAAFRIPDVIFVTIASLASVFILVPMLASKEREEDRQRTVGNVLLSFSIAMILASVVLFFSLPWLLEQLFPTLLMRGDILLTISRILLIQPIFLGVSGMLASVTQVHGRFLLYATAPLLYNAGIIFGIVVLYPFFGLPGIAIGVVAGAFLHMTIQIPFVVSMGYLRPHMFKIRWRELFDVITISIPRTVSIAANHIALLALVVVAAGLGVGSIAVFNLAFSLQSAPLSIIGASYSVAAFPTLARFYSRGDTQLFIEQVTTAGRHIIFWSLPLVALFVVLRAQIVRVILGTGAFDWSDTRLTAAALALFVISLTAQALTLLFVRGYYAAGYTRKPLLVNIFSAIGIVAVALWFIHIFQTNDTWRFFFERLLRVEDVEGTVVLMLPLAYTILALMNTGIFVLLFERDFKSFKSGLSRALFNSFSAAIIAGFLAHVSLRALALVLDIDTFVGIFTQGAVSGLVGVAAGIAVLILLDSEEMKEARRTFHKKIWKGRAIFSSGIDQGTTM
jgi:putative peptidoglycan lipid II flippase